MVLLIVVIGIFVYAMSQITELGVGSFIGNGELEITLPGTAESNILMCNWGPGIGFYLVIISALILASFALYSRFKKS
jgi:hypothetical protein